MADKEAVARIKINKLSRLQDVNYYRPFIDISPELMGESAERAKDYVPLNQFANLEHR